MTAPATWSSFIDARKSKAGHGLGFVLGEGIGCIDLDHVIDESGNLDSAATDLVASLPPTWVEVSPSGTGLHIWGLIPEAVGRVMVRGGISVERYSRGRYITVTGKMWRGSVLSLADLSETLDW